MRTIIDDLLRGAMHAGLPEPSGVIRAQTAAARASADAARVESALRDLQDRLDRVVLACAAVWSLAKERAGLSDKDLLDRVQEVDLKDGRLDGRIQRRPVECVACGRPMSPRHMKCIYCGGATLKESVFQGL